LHDLPGGSNSLPLEGNEIEDFVEIMLRGFRPTH
jgi:hypothetical protein